MKVADARRVAAEWVDEVASGLPGFRGAFFHGSINWMPAGAAFPPTSDVDVGVVFEHGGPAVHLGKFVRDGVLVEGSPIDVARVSDAEKLLCDNQLAHSFRSDSLIADPGGALRPVQQEVARRFAERRFVLARCEFAKQNALRYLGMIDAASPERAQVMGWAFAEGNLCLVLLAACLQNPTVRGRYAAVRAMLEARGRLDVHERLLEMFGCAALSRSRAELHLERMTELFDRAAAVLRSEFPFGSNITALSRPVAVDGSRALIERGEHREAMFWIVVTWARCIEVLETDGAPGTVATFEPAFRELMRDLGVATFEDRQRSVAELEAYLPTLMGVARELIAGDPEIRD